MLLKYNLIISLKKNYSEASKAAVGIIYISTATGLTGLLNLLRFHLYSWHVVIRGIYRMNDVSQDLSWLVATNMPPSLKNTLFAKLEMIYPNVLKNVDTTHEGKENSFPSVHFSYWFKYGRRVCAFFILFTDT